MTEVEKIQLQLLTLCLSFKPSPYQRRILYTYLLFDGGCGILDVVSFVEDILCAFEEKASKDQL